MAPSPYGSAESQGKILIKKSYLLVIIIAKSRLHLLHFISSIVCLSSPFPPPTDLKPQLMFSRHLPPPLKLPSDTTALYPQELSKSNFNFWLFISSPKQVLELARNAARDNKKNRIVQRHIQLAVRNVEELSKLLVDVTIANGGVLPNIHQTLLPKKAGYGKGEIGSASQEF
nr:histone H2AX [Ipomoea batatas]